MTWFENEDTDRWDRLMSTLAVIGYTLADFRDRLETLERPSRWARIKARWSR